MICTLGNFATKLLTGSQRGITRCTARRRSASSAAGCVTLYPIFHPAAALRTPKVKEQLREDFARLPALLAEAVPQPEPAASRAAEAAAARPTSSACFG